MLSLLSGLSFFQHAAIASAAVAADDELRLCRVETIPKDILDTLDRRFYGWKVQDSSNLLPKVRQKWAAIAPLTCPGIATGHLEESRSISYALLLVPVDPSVNGYKFVVFTAASGQSFYGFKMLDQSASNASAFFIHPVAIDRVFDSTLKQQFRPRMNDAVMLFRADDESASQNVFYWKGDGYERAQVDYQ